RKIVWAEAQIWGTWGEICASGAPNDFSRSSETPIAPTHYSEEPKINGFHIVRVEIATVGFGSFAMTFEALAMMKKMYEDDYIFLTAMV
ncbi:MAG: hypothetical protein ABIL62_17850, partial [Planctomycetota bacterium]